MGIENLTITLPESYAPELSPGHKMTLPCAHALENKVRPPYAMPNDLQAHMTIRVTYRPDWVWWHKTSEFPLEAEKTADGNWIWKSLPR